jgi:hypothetical protein
MDYESDAPSPKQSHSRKSRDEVDVSQILSTRTRPAGHRPRSEKQKENGLNFSNATDLYLHYCLSDENQQASTIAQLKRQLKTLQKAALKSSTNSK